MGSRRIFRKIIDTCPTVCGEWLIIQESALGSTLNLYFVFGMKGMELPMSFLLSQASDGTSAQRKVLGIGGPFTTLGKLDLSSVPSLTEVQMQCPNSSLQEFQ